MREPEARKITCSSWVSASQGLLTARTLSTARPARRSSCSELQRRISNVRKGKDLGLPVYYGVITPLGEEALGHAHLALKSRLLVVLLMNDQQAAQRVVDTVRRVAPSVPML